VSSTLTYHNGNSATFTGPSIPSPHAKVSV
jgi:hypothetical protein